MSQRITPPDIDPRKASDLFRTLREMVAHYVPEWPAKDDDDPGVALLKIFSFIGEGVISRLNRAPERNFLAFLDMLGIRLLQARAAQVPVRFLVANGTEVPFLVDKGTQVSAPPTGERPEDLPFETLTPLLVIPSTLASLIAVDPELDAIYRPPPGFLKLESAAVPLPELRVMAFSGVGAKNLQLDPPEQVKKNDFLRVDQKVIQRSGPDQCVPIVDEKESSQSEHLVVADDPKGAVVPLMDPLKRDYVEGTAVRKVTQFELFEAKNWQEHILYLAHSEYFSIKSEAEITIRVQHAGTSSNLQRLNVVWEFFGSVEALKDEPDTWHEFQLDSDGTQGLSRNGQIRLTKPEGEIKETEIDGRKSRWIRARLDQSLPANSTTPVPKIELIDFTVSSAGKALPPDNAFHNDTPLTTDVAFFPFGTEPRIFDRFSIASEEAFSKPGAEVTLDLKLDFADLLASPVAIIKGNQIRVFALGAAGRLIEFQINAITSIPSVVQHRLPDEKRLIAAQIPSVVEDAGKTNVGVFVRDEDGGVQLRYLPNNVPGNWIPITNDGLAGTLAFGPSAIFNNGQWRVFGTSDTRVFWIDINPAKPGDPVIPGAPAKWTELLSPVSDPRPAADSKPSLVQITIDVGGGIVLGFVWTVIVDQNGHTWVHNSFGWRDLWSEITTTDADEFLAARNTVPHVIRYTDAALLEQARIFFRSANNELVVLNTEPAGGPRPPRNLGSPPGTAVDSAPFVSVGGNSTRVFVRGANNQLWIFNLTTGEWTQEVNPLDVDLAGDPFVLTYPNPLPGAEGEVISMLSTSNKNLLLEYRLAGTEVDSGTIAAGPDQILHLEHDMAAAPPEHYVQITEGNGANSSEEGVRKIKAVSEKFAVLEAPLDEIPDGTTRYQVFEEKETDVVVTATTTTVTMKNNTTAGANNWVFVSNQLREIESVTDETATIKRAWTTLPEAGEPYVLLRRTADSEEAGDDSAKRLALKSNSIPPTINRGFFIAIDFGPGQPSVVRKIEEHIASLNALVLDADLPGVPPVDAAYLISIGTQSETWRPYSDPDQTELRPELSWEYFNGKGFVHLPLNDSTRNFLVPGKVVFTLPDDIAKTEVAGQENFWIRARIVGGDYGREQFTFNQKTGEIKVEKDPIRPPRILNLDISYDVTEHKEPQFCVTFNSLTYLDQTAANVTPNKNFFPFVPLSDEGKALYLGFDRAFRGGPVKIYFAAKELEVDERNTPKLSWQFAFENNWKELLPEDGTEGFTRPDFVTLNVTDDIQNRQQFGSTLYWLRTTLIEGAWNGSPLFSGVFLNTVEAMQARTVLDEILGSSVGVKNQKFQFQQTPVIKGEEVRVLEALTDEEREQLLLAKGEDTVRTIKDQAGRVLATWIRWTEVPEFFDSDSNSRHYRLDRHAGEIEFGDGIHGRIPPAGGDNIVAFRYQAGGGASGNVKPGEINSLITAVAGVDSVINPVAAGGGSNAATNEDMLTIGPAQISHRDRAVTPDDFERLALEASREVRKVQCLPNRNASGRHELGWTTVHIVPNSEERQPVPSLGLRRTVQRYLADRADVTIVDQKHILIGPPKYVPVTVEATIYAKSLDLVAKAEQNVKKGLETFLHPLKGGPEKQGWEFGRDLAASDLYALLEGIDEVDYVGSLQLFLGNSPSGEQVEVAADALIASGTHRITTTVAPENK